jgi:hypothetical protein
MATTAPNVINYTIPQGQVHFTLTGGTRTHLGNCRLFTYTPTVTTKDHFQSMTAIRSKDFSPVTQVSAVINMELDEINEYNLALFLLANPMTSGALAGLSDTQLIGILEFAGANSIGSLMTFNGTVQLKPTKDLSLVQDNDNFQIIPLSADVLLAGGAYGHWTVA